VREIRWLYVLPQLALLGVLVAVGIILSRSPTGVMIAASCYLVYSRGSRAFLARDHNRGIRLFRDQHYADAFPHFKASQTFFERHAWIDRYRAIVLLSSSAASYHEMALLNQAACLIHLHRGAEAKALYDRTIHLYPDSPLAKGALAAIEAGASIAQASQNTAV
jgi:hypothetical protein